MVSRARMAQPPPLQLQGWPRPPGRVKQIGIWSLPSQTWRFGRQSAKMPPTLRQIVQLPYFGDGARHRMCGQLLYAATTSASPQMRNGVCRPRDAQGRPPALQVHACQQRALRLSNAVVFSPRPQRWHEQKDDETCKQLGSPPDASGACDLCVRPLLANFRTSRSAEAYAYQCKC